MYVVAIKEVTNIFGEIAENPEWKYGGIDNFAGPFSTGYPVFCDLYHAIRFKTPVDAEMWFRENARYLEMNSRYDKTSLCIQKIVMETVKSIDIRKEMRNGDD